MNEAEWTEGNAPRPMCDYVRLSMSRRKERLLAGARCRLLFSARSLGSAMEIIEQSERYADGLIEYHQMNVSSQYLAFSMDQGYGPDEGGTEAALLLSSQDEPHRAFWVRSTPEQIGADADADLCYLLREIIGNPFRPLPPRPAAIAPLAERIYSGEWELMPLLGEWLQEQGFWAEGEHCLDPKLRHFKGCWVVDWVTDRE